MKQNYNIPTGKYSTFYEILGVGRGVTFQVIKKSYYRRAKECHPDLHGESMDAEAEFKLLVSAFDVLSDPDKRYHYDEYLRFADDSLTQNNTSTFTYHPSGGSSVMDRMADDILEELVVGNHVPDNATLQTLMRDLERTQVFVRFREGRNYLADGQYARAFAVFQKAVEEAPENILYNYYLGQSAEMLRKWSSAGKCYRICLKIGATRNPQQRLQTVRDALFNLRESHGGVFGSLRNWLSNDTGGPNMTPEEKMVEDTSRVLWKMLTASRRRKRAQERLKGDSRPPRGQLGE